MVLSGPLFSVTGIRRAPAGQRGHAVRPSVGFEVFQALRQQFVGHAKGSRCDVAEPGRPVIRARSTPRPAAAQHLRGRG